MGLPIPRPRERLFDDELGGSVPPVARRLRGAASVAAGEQLEACD